MLMFFSLAHQPVYFWIQLKTQGQKWAAVRSAGTLVPSLRMKVLFTFTLVYIEPREQGWEINRLSLSSKLHLVVGR